jgi:ABC-2 type transport system ATP-binding protein
MRRRLEIARSLMHRPRILFLDEPTTGLDPVSRRAMWDMIRRLKSSTGVTLFLTTHYMEEADQICDQVAIFDHGHIVAQGTPGRLKAQAATTEAIDIECDPVSVGWLEVLRGLPGVIEIDARGDGYTIHSRERAATVSAVIEAAGRSQVTISSLHMRGSTLEDVFVQLTGRDLRDAADEKRRLDVRHLYDRQR